MTTYDIDGAFQTFLGVSLAWTPTTFTIAGAPTVRGEILSRRGRFHAIWANEHGIVLGGEGRIGGDLFDALRTMRAEFHHEKARDAR